MPKQLGSPGGGLGEMSPTAPSSIGSPGGGLGELSGHLGTSGAATSLLGRPGGPPGPQMTNLPFRPGAAPAGPAMRNLSAGYNYGDSMRQALNAGRAFMGQVGGAVNQMGDYARGPVGNVANAGREALGAGREMLRGMFGNNPQITRTVMPALGTAALGAATGMPVPRMMAGGARAAMRTPVPTAAPTPEAPPAAQPERPEQPKVPSSPFHGQLAYWKSIMEGKTGDPTSLGNIINDRMKGRAERNINYYTMLGREQGNRARRIRARQAENMPVSDTERNYLDRIGEFESGRDPNAFNSDRSLMSERLLQRGLG